MIARRHFLLSLAASSAILYASPSIALYPFCRALRFANFAPPEWEKWAELLEGEVRNRIDWKDGLEVLPGRKIVPINSALIAIAKGMIDIALVPARVAAARVPDFTVLDDPRLFKAGLNLTDGNLPLVNNLRKSASRLDLEILGVAWNEEYVWTRTKIADTGQKAMEGLKIRAFGDLDDTLLRGLGAAPVPVAFAEVAAALQAGAIDGVITSPQFALQSKLPLAARFGLDDAGIRPLAWTLVMSKRVLSNATDPDKIREVFREAGIAATKAYQAILNDQNQVALKTLMQRGARAASLSRNDNAALLKGIYGKLDARYQKQGVDPAIIEQILRIER